VVLLALFALIAGAATAVSPCVLPVLPVVLSAGATGGRRRPLGIVTGLTLSFTFATVALVYVIDALGLPDDLLRTAAIAILLLFGATLIVPALSARLEAWLQRIAPKARRGDPEGGFWSGALVGFSLGFVYAPCAGPILAGVITVSAAQSFTAGRLAVAFSYGIGSAIVLYALMLGGRRATRRLSRNAGRFQMATGAVMVVMAMAMLGDLDTRFQTAIATHLPSVLVDPAASLEKSASAQAALTKVRRPTRSKLEILGEAPDFTGNQKWFNTPGGKALSLADLRGKVVLVDFWTYTCINCIRTLPYLKALDRRYRKDGLVIVGVHTPEFPFERDAGNVRDAIDQNHIEYAVAQDNDYETWDAYGNQYWPAEYFIDAKGRVRFTHFGEGAYKEKEHVVRELLKEAGHTATGPMTKAKGQAPSPETTTPETYLGTSRNPHPPGYMSFIGPWHREPDSAESGPGSRLRLQFHAKRVFLVLGSPDRARTLDVILDGRPYRHLTIRRQQLYALVELPRVGEHELELRPEPGIQGYAFTFG
jgi:cytochrome c biogenesis protein CcdA/thiol-disulfide isomerase/thioredoxin